MKSESLQPREALPVELVEVPRAKGEPTILSRDDAIRGELRISGDGQILGQFEGSIDCQGELIVGAEAEVKASIRASVLTVDGKVQGDVHVSGRLRLTGTACLEGDARMGSLVVEEGAVHRGAIYVQPEDVAPEPTLVLASQAARRTDSELAAGERLKKLWGELF